MDEMIAIFRSINKLLFEIRLKEKISSESEKRIGEVTMDLSNFILQNEDLILNLDIKKNISKQLGNERNN